MGCRPSRRAAAAASCVRVVDSIKDGAARPLSGDTGSSRLTERCRRKESGRKNSSSNPRDRYSAPPGDCHFPPHSCTTATYRDGCCGATSRITVRLSKNGSTLEIEKCEFQGSEVGGGGYNSSEARDDAVSVREGEEVSISLPLRTQSAPNLSDSSLRRDIGDDWPDQDPGKASQFVVRRFPCAAGTLGDDANAVVASGCGSVRTTASVRVEVEFDNHHQGPTTNEVAAATPAAPRGPGHNGHQLHSACLSTAQPSRMNHPEAEAKLGDERDPLFGNAGVDDAAGLGPWPAGVAPSPSLSTSQSSSLTPQFTQPQLVDLTSCCSGKSSCMTAVGGYQTSRGDGRGKHADPGGGGGGAAAGRKQPGEQDVTMSRCRAVTVVSRAASNGSGSWDRHSTEASQAGDAQVSGDSTDTGCESDDTDRGGSLSRLEIAPAYVHADFRNDFDDLFDDNSPGSDKR